MTVIERLEKYPLNAPSGRIAWEHAKRLEEKRTALETRIRVLQTDLMLIETELRVVHEALGKWKDNFRKVHGFLPVRLEDTE